MNIIDRVKELQLKFVGKDKTKMILLQHIIDNGYTDSPLHRHIEVWNNNCTEEDKL
jgi:glycosylphosphatidylinositol transamidase (GPIT) subunit GPI8